MRRAAFGLGLLALAGLALALPACAESYSGEADIVRTATVPVGRATTFVVDAPVPLLVTGIGGDELVYELRGVMTASTASIAAELAAEVVLSVEDLEPQGKQLVFTNATPKNGRLQAELRVWIPEDMDAVIVSRGGTVDVVGVEGDLDIDSAAQARVIGAEGSVDVGVESGAALVQTSALPGSVTDVRTRAGDIVIELPNRVSAQIAASAGGMGQIAQRHPNLPAHLGGDFDYVTTVNGGLSAVQLRTVNGNIIIQASP